jgi:hypothetical protein
LKKVFRIICGDLDQAGDRPSFPRKKRARVRRFSKQARPGLLKAKADFELPIQTLNGDNKAP